MDEVLNRTEIEEKYIWDLIHIFKSDEDWEKAYTDAKANVHNIEKFKGKLNNAKTILESLRHSDEELKKLERLDFYASLKSAEDTKVSRYLSMSGKVDMLGEEYASAYSFFRPEILLLSDEKIDAFCQELPELAVYKRCLQLITRKRDHILSEKEERILAMASGLASAPHDVFTLMNNADFKFGKINGETGEVEVTLANFQLLLKSQDRGVRERAYKTLYSRYLEYKHSLAALLNASVKKHVFYTKARKYGNSVESALYPDEIDTKVFYNLIESVNDSLPTMHEYISLRKEVLNYDELRMWDISAKLSKAPDKRYSYEEALSMVRKGLEPMGKEYLEIVEKMIKERWMDVFPTKNKLSGAFSYSIYDCHPHILLNHSGVLHDVFTIAHEMGHSMHSVYSKTQPFAYSGYTLLCAEIASNTNEQILMRHLLETSDETLKAYLLNQSLDDIRTSWYRQTMFSEFEKEIHSMMEQNEPLNAENLCKLYGSLNSKYYSTNIVTDDEISVEWSRIPHFYRNFYVYSYATGISAALAISKNIFENGEQAAKEYIDNFLKAGTSKPPLEILQDIGVDLTTKKQMEKTAEIFEERIKELKKLIT